MTWSNVGDEPARAKLDKKVPAPPRGAAVHARGGLKQRPGAQRPEPPLDRAERLRRIARGGS